ncbi:hypothetical protein V3G47_25090 [Escherichia coli]|uniref:hypothetical protein n=1 Tax=Escherichia coli TaxID=562 RepID=UPI002F25EC0D
MANIFIDAKGKKQNLDEIRKTYENVRVEADTNIVTKEIEGYYLRGDASFYSDLEIPIDEQTYNALK